MGAEKMGVEYYLINKEKKLYIFLGRHADEDVQYNFRDKIKNILEAVDDWAFIEKIDDIKSRPASKKITREEWGIILRCFDIVEEVAMNYTMRSFILPLIIYLISSNKELGSWEIVSDAIFFDNEYNKSFTEVF